MAPGRATQAMRCADEQVARLRCLHCADQAVPPIQRLERALAPLGLGGEQLQHRVEFLLSWWASLAWNGTNSDRRGFHIRYLSNTRHRHGSGAAVLSLGRERIRLPAERGRRMR